jgi:glycosyltransferase 2 family protein
MPHHEIFVRVGVASLAGTLLLAGFCIAMRVAGETIAAVARRIVSILSARFGEAVESKLLAFRQGLNAVSSLSDFVIAAALSLIMWLMIATAYMQTANAFAATPSLATLTFSRTMLLVAASIGGSLLQLPVLGWFTQIATNAAAMHAFYGTPLEPATACAALLLIITFISVIPIGLVYARIERVSLSGIAHASEAAKPEAK